MAEVGDVKLKRSGDTLVVLECIGVVYHAEQLSPHVDIAVAVCQWREVGYMPFTTFGHSHRLPDARFT